jgi:hypothetical protein
MSDQLTANPTGTANDILMAKEMAEALHSHYPGHLWAVTCDGETGMADVRNLLLSGNWGFRLRLPATYSASEFRRRVVMAGGELLERYRIKRGRLNPDDINNLRADFAGQAKADL